ncbi:hypothetical protein LUZ60_011779 [Juncus effusus]|nr:hypothetical protein LUZ60_011779 [Juncus effusus]
MEISHKDHLFFFLHHFSILFFLLFCLSTETFIFLSKYHPIYHLIPISFTIFLRHCFSIFSYSQVYIVDFSCLKPPKNLRVPISNFIEHLSLISCFDKESVSFMAKVITSSGMGNETYFPPSLHLIPPSCRYQDAVNETHMLFFPTLDELFKKTNVSPQEIDLIVVNCSGFCPSPSLSSIIVNRYKMRRDVKSYNISGMGCSAGVIGADIAKQFLETRRVKSYALVVSTEIVSTGWYSGKDPRKLILNCFFRTGCSAALLTNQTLTGTSRPKYRISHLLRTQHSNIDRAYHSTSREEDDKGISGYSIERYLVDVVSNLVRSHIISLAPIILPWQEKLRYVIYYFRNNKGIDHHYVPDFRKVVNHFCMPSSGKTLIKRVGKGLGFDDVALEAVLATFHRFGNQSSASMWYQLAYLEAKGRVNSGGRVWQLGLGSGPKCNSLVLECVRDIKRDENSGPWSDCVHRYAILMNHEIYGL